MLIHKMCRICLSEDKMNKIMQPLFDEKNVRCAEIIQRIEECGGIVLKPHEEFPSMICFQCLDLLNTSYKFRLMCQSSEQALLDAIVKSELKTEPIEFASSSNKSKSMVNDEEESEEMFFDLRSELIEGQDVDFEELDEEKPGYSDDEVDGEFFAVEEQDIDEIDGEEHLDDSDTENEIEKLIDDDEFVPIPKKRKPKVDTKFGKKAKVKIEKDKTAKDEKQAPKVRGRKRKNENETETNICEVCGNIYAKRSLLNMHMRRHRAEKPFECEICGKQFTCPSEIGRHIRIHTGEKPYVCRFCGRTFADRSTNIKHERIHTNERPFSCQTCGKSFTYSNVLKNHMLTHTGDKPFPIHTNERPFTCQTCGKSFTYSNVLKSHMLTHTGEKPFPCIPCNKTFSRKHQLEQHLGTITHQQTVKNIQAAANDDGTQFFIENHE